MASPQLIGRADLTNVTLTPGSAGGGQLIHPTFAQEVIKTSVEHSVALSTFPIVQVPTGVLSIPVLSSLPTAGWVTEVSGASATASLKPATEPAWKGINLVLAELAAIVPIPLAVLRDAAATGFNLWEEVKPLVGQAIAMKVDEAVFFGGTSGHTAPSGWQNGLVKQAVDDGHTHDISTAIAATAAIEPLGTTDDYLDQTNLMMADVEAAGYMPDQWYAGVGMRSVFRGMRDSTGQPIYLSTVRDDKRVDSLYDTPLTYMPAGSWDSAIALALVGDPSLVRMGVSLEGMQMDMLKEATIDISAAKDGSEMLNLAQSNAVALRVSFRVAYAMGKPANARGDAGVPFSVLVP